MSVKHLDIGSLYRITKGFHQTSGLDSTLYTYDLTTYQLFCRNGSDIQNITFLIGDLLLYIGSDKDCIMFQTKHGFVYEIVPYHNKLCSCITLVS